MDRFVTLWDLALAWLAAGDRLDWLLWGLVVALLVTDVIAR
jgi:hypothetical protein